MNYYLPRISFCGSKEEYHERIDDCPKAYDAEIILGVFDTMERAKNAVNSVIADLSWHETGDDTYAEWADDKDYFFKSEHGYEHFVTFVNVDRVALNELDKWVLLAVNA